MPATSPDLQFLRRPVRHAPLGKLGQVCRLGLATRGNTYLDPEAVSDAVRKGVNYLNWCGYPDGLSTAVRAMGENRRNVFIATQLSARTAAAAREELDHLLGELGTDYLDVVTHYYLERTDEWDRISAPGGAGEALRRAQQDGKVRAIGVTSHQRPLAAEIAASGRVDLLMVRYNAAHRGAEHEVFPECRQRRLPVVAYTALRWGALLRATPDDPPDFQPPRAPEWYRFVLCHPSVTVALAAPDGTDELIEDLSLLDNWRGLTPVRYEQLRSHGDRVYRHAGGFP